LTSPSTSSRMLELSSISMMLIDVALVALLAQRGRAQSTQIMASGSTRHYQTGVLGSVAMVLTWLWVIVVSILPLLALASQALLPAPGVPLTLENITLDNIITAVTS